METKKEPLLIERALPIFLMIITAIVVVFMAQLMLETKAELREIKTKLDSMKAEAATTVAFEPFAILDRKCTTCHSERKFTGLHNKGMANINQIVELMKTMPDARLSSKESQKVHSSLELLQCVKCHDEQALKKLAALRPEQRQEVIQKMADMPGAEISPDQVKEIQRILQNIQGF